MRVRMPLWAAAVVAWFTEIYGKATGTAVMLTREKVGEMRERYWICDSARPAEEPGWTHSVAFAQGARLTAAWYRENGWL